MAESNLLGQQVQGYTITKKLGSGGYGTVYLGTKEDRGGQYHTAIKHISMPDAEAYDAVMQDYNYDKAATQEHFEKMVAGITSEINTLLSLSKKDNRYIVAYYDHDIQRSVDPLRFDIFMRMEYLTPLNRAIRNKGMTLGEVIKLGIHMCDALVLCHGSDIMHRDIKEANIFISDDGNYKLGDFGVAKTAFESTQAGSIKGTASYMAPEIYLREPYDKSVDVYSLGIVLYKLLNNQRLPFMPDAPAAFTADDKNNAESRRIRGETPPIPYNAKRRLGEIIIKACSVKAQRYKTAEEFKNDLSEYSRTLTEAELGSMMLPPSEAKEEPHSAGTDALFSQRATEKTEISFNPQTYTQTQGNTMTIGAASELTMKNPAPPPTAQQNPYADAIKTASDSINKKLIALISGITGVVVVGAIVFIMVFLGSQGSGGNGQTASQNGDRSTNGAETPALANGVEAPDIANNERILYNADGSWIEREFDSEGKVIWAGYYDQGGTRIVGAYMEYDDNGNEARRIGYYWEGDDYEYVLDDNGKRIEAYRIEFEYDANGHLIKESYYRESGLTGDMELLRWIEHNVAANGNRIDESEFSSDGYLRREASYDDNGNKAEEIVYRADGTAQWRWQYTYDMKGNLIRASRNSTLDGKFPDVSDINPVYRDAVDIVTSLDIDGFGWEGSGFLPDTSLARLDFAKMIYNLDTTPYERLQSVMTGRSPKSHFVDVGGDENLRIIDHCVSKGYLIGYEDGSFRPNEPVTMIQFASVMLRLLGYGTENEFIGSEWASNTGRLARELRLTEGMGDVDWQNNIAREEAAQIIMNTILNQQMVAYIEGEYVETGETLIEAKLNRHTDTTPRSGALFMPDMVWALN